MIHKHELSTAISDLRQAFEHVEHYSGRPEVFCLKQLLVNPLSYLLTENIIRTGQGESPVKSPNNARDEIAALILRELDDGDNGVLVTVPRELLVRAARQLSPVA